MSLGEEEKKVNVTSVLSDEILILLTKVDMPFKSIVFQGSFIIINNNYIFDLSELPLFLCGNAYSIIILYTSCLNIIALINN